MNTQKWSTIFSTDQKNWLLRESKFEPFNIYGMIYKHKFENHRAWKLEANAIEGNVRITGKIILPSVWLIKVIGDVIL